MKRAAILPACALSTALILSGCSYVTPTITEDEATEKIQEHAQNTLAALPENAELEERDGPNASPCGDGLIIGPHNRVSVGESFWIRGIPEEKNDTALELMHDHWETNGYQTLNDNRPGDPFINVQIEEDDFLIATKYNKNGTISLNIGSPCLWPDGSPELF